MVPRLVPMLVLALLAGCSAPHDPPVDEGPRLSEAADGPPPPSGPRRLAEDVKLTGTGLTTCTSPLGPDAMNGVNTIGVVIHRQPEDTRIAVRFEWVAVNPTAQSIHFRLLDGPAGDVLSSWDGTSPQDLAFEAAELASLPHPFSVEASFLGCPSGAPVGLHATLVGLQEQPVQYQVSWNGEPFA